MHHTASSPIAVAIVLAVIMLVFVFGTLYARRKGYSGLGGNTIVRCREGHLFTTVWIPGISFKSIRLGIARIQRCPIDNRLTLVVPVNDSELTDEEKRVAAKHHDTRVP